MSSFEKLKKVVEDTISGKRKGIPLEFKRLRPYTGIEGRRMSLIFGPLGGGKSAYLHHTYILSPFEYIKSHNTGIKFKVILFSMERSEVDLLAKWVSRRIFLTEGILIKSTKFTRSTDDDKLTPDEHDLFLQTKDYIDELLEYVDIVEGAQNPTGIAEYVKKYAEQNGKIEEINEYKKIYIPDHNNEIVIIAEDHLGVTKIEKGCYSRKEAIDKLVEYNQRFRDFYGYAPVMVMQLNRNLNNPAYQKLESFNPTVDDIKESSNPAEAADLIISMFDPVRYRTSDINYNVDRFAAPAGGSYFRNIQILKNTYGEDSIRCGMGFMGSTGIFRELPHKRDMAGFDYNSLFNGQYFLENQ